MLCVKGCGKHLIKDCICGGGCGGIGGKAGYGGSGDASWWWLWWCSNTKVVVVS